MFGHHTAAPVYKKHQKQISTTDVVAYWPTYLDTASTSLLGGDVRHSSVLTVHVVQSRSTAAHQRARELHRLQSVQVTRNTGTHVQVAAAYHCNQYR